MSAPAVVPRENITVVREIPVDAIEVGANVRVDPGDLEGLAASIRELGVLQPVKAVEHPGGRYRLVWGQRRLLAARLAGLATIPAIVVGPTDVDVPGPNRAIEQLVENLDRRDLNPIEEATALREVLDANAGTLTQAALAERLGRSPSWLSNSLRLLGLASEVQDKVRAGEISAAHGKAIAALPAKQQRELASITTSNGMSAHRLEQEIAWKRDAAEQDQAKARKTEKWIPKAIAALEAAEVAKEVDVAIVGDAYNVDLDAIRKAVVGAGWKVGDAGSYGLRPERCDCNAVRLEVGGRKAAIEPRCIERRHADQQVNDDHVARKAEIEKRERQLAALRPALRAALGVPEPAYPTPQGTAIRMVAAVVARAGGYWNQVPWDQWLAKSDAEVLDAIVDELTKEWQLRDLDLDALLARLGVGNSQDAAQARVAEKRAARRAAASAETPTVADLEALGISRELQEAVERGEADDGPEWTLEPDRGIDAPICSCGKPKVDAGHARWVCTNPDHDPKADRPAEPVPTPETDLS